ncbi:MAG: efflux RND transporter periplasmic adaptor subunit [Dehalococcoidales bacterium]|nr:efflux RND transporter periplasmic adaptor subunit [Dehalococcoidales bacterium]
MRTVKITLAAFIIAGLIVPMLGCGSKSDEAEVLENQVVTVQRGDLTIEITAAGNLALSRTEDLAFDLFYQEGTVEEVLVEEGDTVEKGQVLAELDISEWEEELEELEDRVTAAERQLTAKQRDLLQKEVSVINAENALERAKDDWLDTLTAGTKVDGWKNGWNGIWRMTPETRKKSAKLERT